MKELLAQLSFKPKESTNNLYQKLYSQHNNYCIEVDFNQQKINYGDLIDTQSDTTSNFSRAENWVVLECVNRLLEKGYSPKNIILEKTYPSGHGHSGRLDICVNDDNGQEYLLIECKTYGKEFDKELSSTQKNGGQLFTYFKFENKANLIMLYASKLGDTDVIFRNEIIKIEDDYRIGSVKDFYDRWNKITKDNGIFDNRVTAYNFISKALTINDLVEITEQDSGTIFNHFLEILRHNVISDKGNAFNKIFTLFLCKVYDEKSAIPGDELKFQWLQEADNDTSFQLRLADLYKNGMKDFLDKEVTDFSDTDFDEQYKGLDESTKKSLKQKFAKLRLEKNNEFAIKEVFDNQSFKENAKIVKEVVELLQKYKLRYNKRQQYLSDFFELLLTTGLKQESGQFFTPVPIAQFIIKSLPLDDLVDKKLEEGKKDELMPFVMDYAAGSGHFLTESMHEMQRLLGKKNPKEYNGETSKKIKTWQNEHFNWAEKYVYGIEKDYRLVKVGKVGCYLHGDGLANVLLSDGLAHFNHSEYKGLLQKVDSGFLQENKQFDVVISNPPYSVKSFKNTTSNYYKSNDFELYKFLTDKSSEIECLFVERTKQLLKDGGIAGIILPSSILSNSGIYTKTREIILRYFEIIAITELGSNTFMATGTNTVVLFLKRKNNYNTIHLKESVAQFFANPKDITLNGIENAVSKYLGYAWEGIGFEDYKTLLQKQPNDTIANHELYQDYQKIKAKDEPKRWKEILTLEQEKLFYFVLTYQQKIVLIKTGEKKAEKQFLGYEFSNAKGKEGIHPIQRGKTIDECTQLFDENVFDNPQKASTYIYKAFNGDLESEIDESLTNNISRANLVDLMSFDRLDFEKTISLSVKKKLKIESKWGLGILAKVADIEYGTRIVKNKEEGSVYPVYGGGGETFKANSFNRENRYIISRFGMSARCMRYVEGKLFLNDSGFTVSSKIKNLNDKYLQTFLFHHQKYIYACGRGVAQKNIDFEQFHALRIPIPPKEIQQKIVDETEALEKCKQKADEQIKTLKKLNGNTINSISKNSLVLISSIAKVKGGKRVPKGHSFSIRKTNNPYLRVSDFKKGTIDTSKLQYIDDEIFDKIKNHTISKDDIYISIAGTIGLVGIIPKELDGKSLTENAAKIIIDDFKKTNQKYFYQILNSNFVKDQIKSKTKAVGVPKLAIKRIKTIKIPLPLMNEQQKIVTKIEKIEAEINKLEAQIKSISQQKKLVLEKYL